MIGIGRRNQLLTIQRATTTRVGMSQTIAWATLAKEYGAVTPLTGAETRQAAQLESVLATGVTIPFRADVKASDRIVVGSRTLEIQSLSDPTARRMELRLLCSEVVA